MGVRLGVGVSDGGGRKGVGVWGGVGVGASVGGGGVRVGVRVGSGVGVGRFNVRVTRFSA